MALQWDPPGDWPLVTTIEAHAAGEPLRIITGGFPEIPGDTILKKRRYAQQNLDFFRTGLMWEPRGHADMYGAILTEPVTPDGDLGVLFLHNEGFSTMCGHGIIALTTVVFDTGMIAKEGESPMLKIDTPAGRVIARAVREGGQVTQVTFENVPSFVFKKDLQINLPDFGIIHCDIAFGGAFYAFCSAPELGLELDSNNHDRLIKAGKSIKQAVMNTVDIIHPYEEDMGFLYGTIFIGPAEEPTHHSRNVCIFAEGEVDRSPTGTGVSARAAIHYQQGELAKAETITIESILGTCFDVRIREVKSFGPYTAVIPEVSGSAYIVGQNRFCFDPRDPLKHGFIFR
jgi:trans-L-3-hydroxyproline dehydratase